jgi:tetratricopeptide (TPR) repeat protein
MFGRLNEAQEKFQAALEKDSKSVCAHTGLAETLVDRDPAAAATHARAALAVDADCGLAHLILAATLLDKDPSAALDEAWKSALNPSTAVAGRALAGEILIGRHQYADAIAALLGPGPWETDPVCWDRRALAHFLLGEKSAAVQLAQLSLSVDPLDTLALGVLSLSKVSGQAERLARSISASPAAVLQLAEEFHTLNQDQTALRMLEDLYLKSTPRESRDPLICYWARFLSKRLGSGTDNELLQTGASAGLFPWDQATAAVLSDALKVDPSDGRPALYLGDVLFHLGRSDEACAMWNRAATLDASPVLAYRALGMASLNVDHDHDRAAVFLLQAHHADPADAIVARDLARVLLSQADKTDMAERKTELWTQAQRTLQAAFPAGKSRSDYVCLLARCDNRLGKYADTAQLLDAVRITVWEGSHEAHDLFEEAHLALGNAELQAGHPAQALKEFDRALEYPENLAIGRLEKAHDGYIHKLRAEALSAMGQAEAARQARELVEREPEGKQ